MLKLYFVLLLGLLVLGQFTSLTKAEGLNLYFFDLFALYFVLYGLVCLKQKKVRLVLPKNIAMLLLFSFVAFSSWLLHAYRYDLLQNLSAIFYLVRFVIYLFSAVVVYNAVKNGLLSKEFVYGAFITGGVALVVAGILQLILLPDFEVLDQSLGWDPHKNRLAATFFDPNFLGCYLVLCFFVLAEKFRLIKLHFG